MKEKINYVGDRIEDQDGKILVRVMAEAEGYLMVKRPNSKFPSVMRTEEWESMKKHFKRQANDKTRIRKLLHS